MNTASTATKLRTRGFGSLGLPNCIDFLILRHGRARRAMNTASTATKLRTRGFGSLGLPNCIGFLICAWPRPPSHEHRVDGHQTSHQRFWVARPTELYRFSDFYASASWSRDALSEKMGVADFATVQPRRILRKYYMCIILPLFSRNMRDMVLTYQA